MAYYASPRWSGEILDCSMPMTFDTYDRCSYNCLYCFAYFQKSHAMSSNYQSEQANNELRWVNVEKIKSLFLLKEKSQLNQFNWYIKERKTMQWGGMADQFDGFEKLKGVTLELLKFFKEINYPLCFSTKGTWWTKDDRYLKIIKNQKNWNCKFSIINLDKDKAKKIEKGVPSPQERLQAIKTYSDLNAGGATLRLRPFIIGYSDCNGEYLDLIKQAYENGSRAVTTEFFCLEGRADENLRKKYDDMSEILGFDIHGFYKKYSVDKSGYLRLNYKIKKPYVLKMQELCEKLGMRFYVSDAHHKEKSHNGSCCGLPSDWEYSKGQFTEAILIAKKNGKVYFSDIEKYLQNYKDIFWCKAEGFNTCSVQERTKRAKQTMYDYIREIWNSPNSGKSPYKYFSGVLNPESIDSDGNVVYSYKPK